MSDACHINLTAGIPATDPRNRELSGERSTVILGASTRAAAWSARRAGFRPICVDLFADLDLRQIAQVIPATNYPRSLPSDLHGVEAEQWLFVGAMENHRESLQELLACKSLGNYLGPSMATLDHLRDPRWLAERLRKLGCYPQIALVAPTPSASITNRDSICWLRKPWNSGGGRGICTVDPLRPIPEAGERVFYQEFVPGKPISAIFLVNRVSAHFMMASQQLTGLPEVSAPSPFSYCGSVGPLELTPRQLTQLQHITETILQGEGYRGLLGIDLIDDGQQFWLIEVNPRYTASCELWELLRGRSAVALHAHACGPDFAPVGQSRLVVEAGSRRLGKLILYAERPLIAPDLSRFLADRQPWSIPWIADIPAPGAVIPGGEPVCTVFASAGSHEECRRKLVRRIRRVRSWFGSAEIRDETVNNS